jgi:hypothetical protein
VEFDGAVEALLNELPRAEARRVYPFTKVSRSALETELEAA